MPKGSKTAQSKIISDQDPTQKILSVIQSDFERRYACPDCNKELSCGSSLKRHLLLKHKKEMTLKFGRSFKGGRSFSNQRYYMKKRKPKDVDEKTDKQLRRSVVNQRAYQKKVFRAEAESLKQAVIEKTDLIVQQYKGKENLRKQLDVAARDLKAQHHDDMYTEIQTTLGLPDTFEIRYSIAFYFLLAIANRLPHFINLEYDRKEVAIGLCWRNVDQDGASENFKYNEKITNAIVEQTDLYFLGKGNAIKEQKLKYMTCIASFLHAVFIACGNEYTLIKKEAKNPCYLLWSLFKEPLIRLAPSKSSKGDNISNTGDLDSGPLNSVPVPSAENINLAVIGNPFPMMMLQTSLGVEPPVISASNATGAASSYNKTTFRFAENMFESSWPSSDQNLNDE
ncbi:C2H2-type zinc finger transcription factor [Mucor lusitanicus]|uniref:C2H2-type zinc finger transcription factor n=2 Tax=Mucor circinelloides f. lusitanicus TaxID=29924 RepID=A0A168IE35_MUCCL|nr:C2H2-type zinc finger transcription factor [Mucor lusitanicus]OAC99862.1 C2H2-type zinc finger transcription factor [Mucor lusitanicus CBS 277.49]